MERYERQLSLVDQEKLKKARVCIAGLGGLGNAVVAYLAAAGVGRLILIDKDVVELSNLNRQILFKPSDVGKKKVDVVEAWIKKFNPEVEVEKFEEICEEAVKKADIVLDCLDNWDARELLWELAFKHGKIVVHGAADLYFGQVAVLLSKEDAEKVKGKGRGGEVVGAVAGLIGTRLALEAIKVLQKRPERSYLIVFDGEEMRKFLIKREPWNCIIAKPSEVWIKSEVTRRKLMRLILDQLSRRIEGKVYAKGPVIFVEPYSRKNLEVLLKTFGIKVVSPAKRVKLGELEKTVVELAEESKAKTFRITAKRVWKGYEKSSIEIQRELGASVVDKLGLKVDLKNPELEIFVEIHRDFALVYTERLEGAGGLPYSSQGRVLVLFSGGIDSPVAAWLLARRGAEVKLLFLNPLGDALESEVYEVYEALKAWIPELELYVVDTSKLVELIREKVKEGYRQVVLKRFMYRIAERVANLLKCRAIATGESLGQTSSQTLANLQIIDEVISLPVLRPLLGMDKEEITELARKIGTYEESSKIAEFCALEKHSNASAKREKVLEEEAKVKVDVEEIVSTLRPAKKVEIPELKPPEDLRDFVIIRLWKEKVPRLDPGKRYVFVCSAGNRAREEALKARRQGIEAYALSLKEAKKRGLL